MLRKCFGFLFEDDVESNQMAPGLWQSEVQSGSNRGGKVHRNSQNSRCFIWLMTHSPAHATKTMNEQQWLRRSPSGLYSYLWNFEWKVMTTACGVQCLLSGQCLTLMQSSAPIQTPWLQPLGREGARDRGGWEGRKGRKRDFPTSLWDLFICCSPCLPSLVLVWSSGGQWGGRP